MGVSRQTSAKLLMSHVWLLEVFFHISAGNCYNSLVLHIICIIPFDLIGYCQLISLVSISMYDDEYSIYTSAKIINIRDEKQFFTKACISTKNVRVMINKLTRDFYISLQRHHWVHQCDKVDRNNCANQWLGYPRRSEECLVAAFPSLRRSLFLWYVPFTWLIVAVKNNKLKSVKQ